MIEPTWIRTTEELGAVVRAARRRQGLRLEDAAAVCNVRVRFLSELERGKPTARVGKVLQVLYPLGIDLTAGPRKIEPREEAAAPRARAAGASGPPPSRGSGDQGSRPTGQANSHRRQ
ncbi:helix-turn-helix domain-containing protein [Deferrisoma palaeochoriense]